MADAPTPGEVEAAQTEQDDPQCVRYTIHRAVIDGPVFPDGAEVVVRLHGTVGPDRMVSDEGVAVPTTRLIVRDWAGPYPDERCQTEALREALEEALEACRRSEAVATIARAQNDALRTLTAGIGAVAARVGAAEREELLALIASATATLNVADEQAGVALAERKTPYVAYRADGWPLCPGCGEDELYSLAEHASVETIVACYRCSWRPPDDTAAAGEGFAHG
jgi:hypothetical protein